MIHLTATVFNLYNEKEWQISRRSHTSSSFRELVSTSDDRYKGCHARAYKLQWLYNMRQITTICLKGKTIPYFLAVRLRKIYEWMCTCTASTSFTETPSLRTRPRWIIQQVQILQNTTASQKTLLILSSTIGICFMKEREIEVPILVAPQYSRI